VISNALGTAALPSYTFTGDLDTGMYHSAANEISVAISGLQKVKIDSTGITVLSGFFSPGTSGATAPEFSFTNDPDTGMFRSAADILNFGVGGATILTIAASGITSSTFTASPGGKYLAPAGVPGVPTYTFTSDPASGIFNFAPGVVAISGAGMIAALFSSGGIFAGPPGSATAPSIAFFSDTDTGLYNSTANNLFVTTFGVQRFVWDSVGNAVVGTGALLTTATAGFLYITTTPGVPTGIPTTYTGRAALVLDTTGNALYGYDPISAVWLNLTGSGGGTPGGADTQVQFNDAGVFGGDSDFTWNKTTNTLTIVGTGTLAMQDGTISRPLLKDYAEVKTSPAVGATTTLDLENGNTFEVTLTQNTTVVISNPPASGNAGNFTFIVTQDGTGSRTITWPGSVRWSGGTPPTLTTTAGKTDILTFVTTDGGSTWYGFTAGLNY
ncbi:MAG: hypothetical protein ACREAU_06185, partial [Nitrosopumilaceae archaeon]